MHQEYGLNLELQFLYSCLNNTSHIKIFKDGVLDGCVCQCFRLDKLVSDRYRQRKRALKTCEWYMGCEYVGLRPAYSDGRAH